MARKQIQIRLNDSGVEIIDHLAKEYGLTRTDVIRCALAVSLPTRELRDMLKNNQEAL